MASVDNPGDTSGSLIAASKVSGTAVYNNAGDRLGSIYDVMIEKVSGKAAYAIMSFGGFLGIGEQYHPLPWSELTYDRAQGGYIVNLDRSQLEGAPAYSADDLSLWDDTRARDVDAYYGSPGVAGGIGGARVLPPGRLVP